jgi:hypothetical protein
VDGGSVAEACNGNKLFIAHTTEMFENVFNRSNAGSFCRGAYGSNARLLELDGAADYQTVLEAFLKVGAARLKCRNLCIAHLRCTCYLPALLTSRVANLSE